MKFEIRQISSKETGPLRHKILRPTQDFRMTRYSGDDLQDAFHMGAFLENRMIGTASIYREDFEDQKNGWRIRGMAIEEDYRGRGVGQKLLHSLIAHSKNNQGNYIWFNARTPAVGFYEKSGFEKVGSEFELPEIGPHFVMKMDLNKG
ncbi:MAG: family N-acetyltransferase [Bacteriovoracaceae bacterium]|nr:family N-acetyltransferase [Bacteriovoracaceae bacterium]